MQPFRSIVSSKHGGKPLFSFAVVADTHINETDASSSSPFETNQTANKRAEQVFKDISAMDPAPAFVLHLGDIVHPVPSVPTFHEAVDRFKAIAKQAGVPVHLAPGNHDVGDKCIDWMPADQVCEDYLRIYRDAFGPDFYAFDHGPVRFLCINSLLLNSGLPDEQKQKQWVEQQIAEHLAGRVYIYMHYPPYIHHAKERSNYDNIDEPGRSWLLEQMAHPNVEAVFAGHVHNFWYDRVGSADFYMLPSTAFLRHDFTEFFKTSSPNEFGRGDLEKFGYFLVDVYADGHVAYSVRTLTSATREHIENNLDHLTSIAHPSTSRLNGVGAELRHPWAESLQISATGGVQEFGRKWARNDYPLLAIWEMGMRLSKVPDLDLSEPDSRHRMELMARMGQRYVVTSLGRPRFDANPEMLDCAGVAAVEVNATLATFARQKPALVEWRKTSKRQVLLAKIHTYDESHFDGKHFSHFVKAGFTLDELESSEALVQEALNSAAIDGITVRIEPSDDIFETAVQLADFSKRTNAKVLASLKTSGKNLATERADDVEMVRRVAQAMFASLVSEQVSFIFDTFMDVDRGYFPRHAFIDRRCDLRPAAHAYTAINSMLSAQPCKAEIDAHDISAVSSSQRFALIHGNATDVAKRVAESACTWVHDLVANTRYSREAFLKATQGAKAERVVILETHF